MDSTARVERLTPLDLLMPGTYVGAVFTFRTTESTPSISARLQSGLDSLSNQLPWLSGRVFRTSIPRDADWTPGLEMRWDGKKGGAPTVLDKGLLIEASYTNLAAKRMPPSAIPAEAWPVPAVLDDATFASGAPVFGSSIFQFGDRQGVGLCISVHHNVVDATGFTEVIRLWVRNIGGHRLPGGSLGLDRLGRLSGALSADVDAITDQSPERLLALHPEHSVTPPALPTEFAPCTSKVFTIPITRIDAIREQLRSSAASVAPTTNTLICALVWSAITRARKQRSSALAGGTSRLAMAVNGRRRLGLQFSTPEDPYFGNAVVYSLAGLEVETLSAAGQPAASAGGLAPSLAKTCAAIMGSQSPGRINSRYIAEIYSLVDRVGDYRAIFPGWDLFSSRDLTITSWADLDLYEMDFGAELGKPEFIRTPHSEADGVGLVMPRRRLADEVLEVVVMLRRDDMEALEKEWAMETPVGPQPC
ncbi:hypothetical protein ACJ41O_011026 [Fusarium nematophilum]